MGRDATLLLHNKPFHSTSQFTLFVRYPPLNPVKNVNQMFQILFETFEVPATNQETPSLLSLFAAGRTTGISVVCGDGTTVVESIFEGYGNPYNIQRWNFGGENVTDFITQSFYDAEIRQPHERCKVSELKHKASLLAKNSKSYYEKMENSFWDVPEKFSLPDGKEVMVDKKQQLTWGEIMFNPLVVGYEFPGICEMVTGTIRQMERSSQQYCCSNIVLSGGSTKFPDFERRFEMEVKQCVADGMKINVSAATNRHISPFIGGSILACLSSYESHWFTQEEYAEAGFQVTNKVYKFT